MISTARSKRESIHSELAPPCEFSLDKYEVDMVISVLITEGETGDCCCCVC